MSEPRLIEPLLSDHIMGEPISDRNGVRCCPAVHTKSEEKYMVKVLSIPAAEKQLEALLLTGACKSKDDALRYFRELADETVEEAELLRKLSRLEGFRSFDAWQTEPMADGNGYEVYLLSPYGLTLERHLRRNCLTHLSAVNLGLDLCAALSVCRRNGWLYVDLKPENVFLSESQGYLIGDLGFLRLNSLKYASLPEKYRSPYTAPEIEDAYSSLNSTLDIYAAGLILYQVYNNGQLPSSSEPMLPPEYADYEMAEIILKACASDPAERWQDPQEMGQALVSYLQRNTVNDDPIIPPLIPQPEPELPASEDAAPFVEEAPAVEEIVEELPSSVSTSETELEEKSNIGPVSEPVVEEAPDEAQAEDLPSEADIPGELPQDTAEGSEEEPEELEQFVIEGFLFDETEPDELELDELPDTSFSDEVSQMLAQADALIAHKAPDPVVAPEPIEVPMPDPIPLEPEPQPAEEAQPAEDISGPADSEAPQDEPDEPETLPEPEDPDAEPPAPRRRRKFGWLIAALLALLLLAAAGFGVKYYYENEYLQHIRSVTLESAEDWLTVTLDTEIDNSLLTVTCTDTYGNKLTRKVENNRATFTSLHSGTTYKVSVTVSGRHQLTGDTTATFTTPAQTSIVGFTGITGDSDGSVILSFSVQGPDASGWLVKYSTEGEAEQTTVCSGHMALVTGLTAGKTYTFRLVPQEELYVVGGDTLEFTASNMICAQNLTIHGFDGGALIASWEVPEGETVEFWTVRCFNHAGVDLTFTVTEPQIAITGLDVSLGYTLDVMASQMTVSKWTSISADSLTFKDILLDDSVPGQLTLTWNYEGTAPEGGWDLIYTVDGSAPITVNCEKNTCTLETPVPGGHYAFDFLLPSDISVFGNTSASWDAPEAASFQGFGIAAEHMLFRMCLAPDTDGWIWEDIEEEGYTTVFGPTDTAGIVIQLTEEYETSPDSITATFIIRDSSGAVVSIAASEQSWTSMWYQGYCELNLPALPAAAGTYTLELLLNGAYITLDPISFTVS